MPLWLKIAEGPIFRFTIILLVLGLARLIMLSVIELVAARQRSGKREARLKAILSDTLRWLFPIGRINEAHQLYSYASFVLHLGILLTLFTLGNHIEILRVNTGLAWPPVRKSLLDFLTLCSIAGGLYLLLHRIYVRNSRSLSRTMDYVLLVILMNIFISGFIAGQTWNPVPYDSLMLFHTLNGLLMLGTIPFTKIAHCILFPLIRLSSEIGWHLVPRAGQKTIDSLYGPEGRKI